MNSTFKNSLLVVTFLFGCSVVFATKVSKTLFLNKGNFITVDTSSFPAYAFNSTSTYQPQSENIILLPNDTLILTIKNNDTRNHNFTIKSISLSLPVSDGDSVKTSVVFPSAGVYVYSDDTEFPKYSYLGLSGTICVDSHNGPSFYWNLRENEKSYNYTLANDSSVNWSKYYPDYFTINGKSYPDIQKDPSAMLTGKIGDTIRIYVANLGIGMHSIHFHGFHCTVKATTDIKQLGWEKDTYLMESMQTFILEMIPDKPGLYPVHDHNLVALTGGGHYPNGMMIMMDIKK